jgi:hypothetical protein
VGFGSCKDEIPQTEEPAEKPAFWCHSERSEESLFDLSPIHTEILRSAQNDRSTFSAASEVYATEAAKLSIDKTLI